MPLGESLCYSYTLYLVIAVEVYIHTHILICGVNNKLSNILFEITKHIVVIVVTVLKGYYAVRFERNKFRNTMLY